MPFAIRSSVETTGTWLPDACRAGVCAEVTTPLNSHERVHLCRVVRLSGKILSLQMDDALAAHRELLWDLPVEVIVPKPPGHVQLACRTLRTAYVSASADGRHLLRLATPSRAMLLLSPDYLHDSIALEEPTSATVRFPNARSSVRSVRWALHHLASGGAACIAVGALPDSYVGGLEGQVSFGLPAGRGALRLRCNIGDVIQLGPDRSLVLLAFEQASRDQSHRDYMSALAAFMRRYWMPPEDFRVGEQATTATDIASEPTSVTQHVHEALESHCHRHDVAFLFTDDPNTSAAPTRLIDIDTARLTVQRPNWPDFPGDSFQRGRKTTLSLPQHGGRLEFETVVLDHQSCDLSGVGRLPVLALQMPSRAELVEQRSTFRTPVNVWPLTEVLIRPGLPDGASAAGRSRRHKANAMLRDVSPGGASLQVKFSGQADWDASRYEPGTPVAVWLRIEGSEPLIVQAEVRNRRYDVRAGCLLLGVQFVGLEASAEGRALKQRLERFAADMQRAGIRRMRDRSRRSAAK
jgi:hypothetical protein